jgi:hypothetical protein
MCGPEWAWLFITNGDESTGILLQKGNIQIHVMIIDIFMLHVRELQIPYTYSLTRFVPDMPPAAVKVIFADGVSITSVELTVFTPSR